MLHDEIKEAVNASGKTDPHERIAEWQRVLSEKCKSLTEEEMTKYGVMAEQWTKEGPPLEIKRQLVSHV